MTTMKKDQIKMMTTMWSRIEKDGCRSICGTVFRRLTVCVGVDAHESKM